MTMTTTETVLDFETETDATAPERRLSDCMDISGFHGMRGMSGLPTLNFPLPSMSAIELDELLLRLNSIVMLVEDLNLHFRERDRIFVDLDYTDERDWERSAQMVTVVIYERLRDRLEEGLQRVSWAISGPASLGCFVDENRPLNTRTKV
jgi:hypothetical protein